MRYYQGPSAAAHKIADAAFASRWQDVNGGIIVGGRLKPLPGLLATEDFQQEFFATCTRSCRSLTNYYALVKRREEEDASHLTASARIVNSLDNLNVLK